MAFKLICSFRNLNYSKEKMRMRGFDKLSHKNVYEPCMNLNEEGGLITPSPLQTTNSWENLASAKFCQITFGNKSTIDIFLHLQDLNFFICLEEEGGDQTSG